MHVRMMPVYSKQADEGELQALGLWGRSPTMEDGSPMRLYRHQAATYRELTTGDADVIFNTAMTGDGKSLAGQLPALVAGQGSSLLAMYPTNELVDDQQRQLARAIADWKSDLHYAPLNCAELDALMATDDYPQRGDALMGVLRNSDVVLTNPDVFHLVMQQFYRFPRDAPDKLIGPMLQKFGQFTFDEFHIFDAPQVISVLNALLFIHEISGPARPHRFLFLSATPGELMLEYLHRSGLKVVEIAGQYAHGSPPLDDAHWRRILHAATLHFDTLGVEDWIDQHLEDTLLPFFRKDRCTGVKGAIIVNSVAAAHRVLNTLRPALARYDLTVEPNTGLTSRARRTVSYAADLLIGTSTVDVGVDFQINFLLFESRDAGSFLQRLGRLGRHDGYQRDGQFYPFETFAAHALVPRWVTETLFDGQDGIAPLLGAGETVDRERLNAAIRQAYPRTADFGAYARLWGELQSVRVINGLSHATIKEQYADVRAVLGQRYESTFGIRIRPAWGRYLDLEEKQRALLDEAISFRGESYLTCCLLDSEEEGVAQFKAADLLSLVGNAQLDILDESTFYRLVEQAGLSRHTFERQHPLAFFRLCGWREERAAYRLWLDRDIRTWGAERFGKAQVLKGWHLDADVPGRTEINNRLCRRELPAVLCLGRHPLALKSRLRLPLLFPLYAFVSRDGVEGCVALGRQALLLETRLANISLSSGGQAIIV